MCNECGELSAAQGSSPGAGSIAKAIGATIKHSLQESHRYQENRLEDPRNFGFSRVDNPAMAAHDPFIMRESKYATETPKKRSNIPITDRPTPLPPLTFTGAQMDAAKRARR